MAIDFLGTIATRLKQEAVSCRRDRFWILQELVSGDGVDDSCPKDTCSVCLDGMVARKLFNCQDCQRRFHADCLGLKEHEAPRRGWCCQVCTCRNQLIVLQSYCKSRCQDDINKSHSHSDKPEAFDPITKLEIVQQMLWNYLQDVTSADDVHLFVRWFVLNMVFFSKWCSCFIDSYRASLCAGFICACGIRMIQNHKRSPCTTLQDKIQKQLCVNLVTSPHR